MRERVGAQSFMSMMEPVEKVTGVTVDGVVAVQVKTWPSVVYIASSEVSRQFFEILRASTNMAYSELWSLSRSVRCAWPRR